MTFALMAALMTQFLLKDSLFVIASYVALLQIMHVIPIVTDALLLTETLDPISTGKRGEDCWG